MGSSGPALATTIITWNNPAGGLWSDPSNWSPVQVPEAHGEAAVLPALSGPYQVTLDIDPALDQLQVANGPTLDLGGHSIASITQFYNAGTLLGLRGTLYGGQFHNQSGGVVHVAHDDSIVVVSGLTNDGDIIVGPDSLNSVYLPYSASFAGSGALVLEGKARISCPLERPQTSIWITNSGNHTLRGAGDVWVPIQNSALLHADGTGGGLLTFHCYFVNSATARVSGGGIMNVDCPLVKNAGRIVGSGGTFTVMMPFAVGGSIVNRGGRLVADGGDLRMGCGLIWEGTVERTGGTGAVRIVSVANPQNLTVSAGGELAIDGLLDLTADGSHLENHGTVRVGGTLNVGGTSSDSISLSGDGVLVLDGGTLGTPAGAAMINEAGHTITGCGSILANLVNYGTLEVDCGGGSDLRERAKTNYGTIRIKKGMLWMWGPGAQLNNRGTVDCSGGVFLMDRGAVLDNTGGQFTVGSQNAILGWRSSNVSIIGGTLRAVDGGAYRNQGKATLQDVALAQGATFTTVNKGTTTATGASLINHGTNRVETGGTFSIGSTTDYLEGGAATVLAGGTFNVPRGLVVHGLLGGTGKIVGDVTNAGVVSPDPGDAGLQIQGSYHQLAGGKLALGLAGFGPGQFSQLRVSGEATLDGSLGVSAATGFDPGTGHTFQVMSSSALSGHFSTMEPSPGMVLVPVYDGGNLLLQATSALAVDDLRDLPKSVRFYTRGIGFGLDLPEAAVVSVRAYDVSGREIARLAEGSRPAGACRLDLRAGAGMGLPSGVYFAKAQLRMGARSEVRTARVVFLK